MMRQIDWDPTPVYRYAILSAKVKLTDLPTKYMIGLIPTHSISPSGKPYDCIAEYIKELSDKDISRSNLEFLCVERYDGRPMR